MTRHFLRCFTQAVISATLLSFCVRAQTPQLPLMPMPASVAAQAGSIPVDAGFTIAVSGAGSVDPRVKEAVARIVPRLARQTGIPLLPHVAEQPESATLFIVVEARDHAAPQRLGDNERYSLEAANGHVRISADAPLGALRGIETFLQLVQANTAGQADGFSVPAIQIHDEPRFPWRGLSLDVSRHFIPVDGVKRTLDGMSAVKLNVFHWHLSDDQGFRVEVKRYPLLQKKSSDGLYYTQADIRDILVYARSRGIRVVPEFDMPGHATSWFAAYPRFASGPGPYEIVREPGVLSALMDPTNEATYRFLDGFIAEMAKLFPDQYFHIGGDEVNPKEWNDNPKIQAFLLRHKLVDDKALQAYFNQRLLKIVTKHGKRMEGWDEILHPDLPKTIVIQSWRGQKSLAEAARQGYEGILSAGYYLDLMEPASRHYLVDPLKGETADLNPEEQKRILGGEAAMWEEIATPENLDAKLWPRLAAIAERFWSPETVTDLPSMYLRLEEVDRWLGWLGLTDRSNLLLMRQRLAGSMPVESLNIFASVLEPVKAYERQHHYTSFSPLNHLVDAIPPESASARQFNDAVDQYLTAPRDGTKAVSLRRKLNEWRENTADVRPTLESNALLMPNLETAGVLERLCTAGTDAIDALSGSKTLAADWKQTNTALVEEGLKGHAETLIQIAPGIQKLVNAVNGGAQ